MENKYEDYANFLIFLIKNNKVKDFDKELTRPRFGDDMKFGTIQSIASEIDFHYSYDMGDKRIRKVIKIKLNMATIGEKRIRTEFNLGNNNMVQNFKERYAHLMNDLEGIKDFNVPGLEPTKDPEKLRLIALAMTTLEESAMWAVKALTI